MASSRVVRTGDRPVRGRRDQARIGSGLFAAGLATFALLYSPQPLLPALASTFGVSAGASTWAVSICTLGLGVTLVIAGAASELVGRVRLMRLSLLASALVGLGCAFAPSWDILLVLRGIEGVTLAGLPAVAMAYLREEITPDRHARAAGLYVGGTALGGMAGRLLSGGLADLADWRVATAGTAALGLVCAVVAVVLLPPSRHFVRPARGDGRLLAQSGRVLRDPALLALYGVAATGMGAFVAVYNAMGFRLTTAPYRLSVGVAGLVFAVYLVGSFASTQAGRIADRRGRRSVVPAACLLALAGLGLTLARSLPVVVVGLAVLTAGFFAAHGVASGWVTARAQLGGGGTGQAAAAYLVAYYLGSSVFGSVAGLAWSGGGWPGVVGLAGGLLTVTLLLSVLLRRIPPLRPG